MLISSQARLIRNIFLIFFIIFSTSVFSQQKTTFKVLGIAAEGNISAEANTIIVSSGLKVGDEIQVPGDKTINAIKNLWALNIFSDIQILKDKQVGDGVLFLSK